MHIFFYCVELETLIKIMYRVICFQRTVKKILCFKGFMSSTYLFQNGWVDPVFETWLSFGTRWPLVTHARDDVSYFRHFPSYLISNL